MTAITAQIHAVKLRLRHPLMTARGPIVERNGFVVQLRQSETEAVGVGDAFPLPGWPGHDLEGVGAELRRVEKAPVTADTTAGLSPVAAAAIDVARGDLAAQRQGSRLADWARSNLPDDLPDQPPVASRVAINALLRSASPTALGAEASELANQGYPVLKLKVAALTLDDDFERIAAVRHAVAVHNQAGPSRDVRLRLDANRGWTLDQAREMCDRIEASPIAEMASPVSTTTDIDYVEDPVGNAAEMEKLKRSTPLRIAADELASTPQAAWQIIDDGLADVVVCKPMWMGPLAVTLALAQRARTAGLGFTVTSALDSAIGVTAATHIAAAIPSGSAAGITSPSIFANDVAELTDPHLGVLQIPAGAGLGQHLDPVRHSVVEPAANQRS